MKALEILKAIKEQEDTHLWLDDGSGYPKKYIIEAIKELEELENRSCENCKFKYVRDSMCTECRCNESPIDYIDFDCFPFFSCREWEAKK